MKQILIADDEPHVIRVMSLRLKRAGYDVEAAANGAVALEQIRAHQPDVLITDVQMPRMTGRELCEQIQAEFPDRKFLVVVLTSRTEVEHRDWSRKLTNTRFLEKPASMTQLLAMLEDYFAAQVSIPNGTP